MAVAAFRSRTARLAIAAAAIITVAATAAPASAGSHVAISGSGSSWASLAIDLWAQGVRPQGLVVNFNPDGSAAGRADFIAGQDDFTASDVPFRNGHDQLGGTAREVVPWGYSYIPLPAGGVAFPYHIFVPGHPGHLLRSLRLSGETLMEIFTGRITNWDNPQITHDNGAQLPDLPITPVVRADGSGATYYFTRWMAHLFPHQWNAFCDQVHPGIVPPCGQTEFYPTQFGRARAENGGINVMAYITSSFGNGAIGYDEYAYPLGAHWPVAKLRNPAGDYVLPTAANVTAALTQAVVDTDPHSPAYLQVNLDKVYTYNNPASYPLSYSGYLIVPRADTKPPPPKFTNAKGRTLSAFTVFALCRGQAQLASLGYAPLPPNLVRDGLQQAAHIPGHGPVPTPAACH